MRSRIEFQTPQDRRFQVAADAIVLVDERRPLNATRDRVVVVSYRVGPRDALLRQEVAGSFDDVFAEASAVVGLLRLTDRETGLAVAVPPSLVVSLVEQAGGSSVVHSNGTTSIRVDAAESYELVRGLLDAADSADVESLEATVPREDDAWGVATPDTSAAALREAADRRAAKLRSPLDDAAWSDRVAVVAAVPPPDAEGGPA